MGAGVNDPLLVQWRERGFQALLLGAMENTDLLCSTSSLPQCGQRISPSAYSASVSTFENVFWQAWQ